MTAAALPAPDVTDRVDAVVDGVLLFCEQSTWCWTAHDDTHTRFGRVTPTVTEPYLDLGAGEVAAQLAWIDHLLGPALDERAPGVRWRIRQETQTRVFRPFTDRRRAVAELVAEGIAAYWASLPADGGVDEGYHYWWQGAARALEAQDLLGFAGIEAEPAASDRIHATIAFPHAMHLGGDWYVNVSDGAARPLATWPWNVVHSWALRVGVDAAAQHAASYRGRPGGLFDERTSLPQAVRMLCDAAWADAPAAAPPLVGRAAFLSTGVAVARATPGSARGPAVSVKGGHNGENHNHVDLGSVIVALDGVPLVVDAGKPTHRAGTFGPDRYDLWAVRGDWHNVPRVRGVEQAPGEQFAVRGFKVSDAPVWRARLDLGGAYPVDRLEHWWREVSLDPGPESVTVDGSWSFSATSTAQAPTDGSTAWHWLLAGDVTLAPGRAVVRFTPDGAPSSARALALTWDAEAAGAALDTRRLDDPELTAVWGDHLTRLRLTARSEALSGTFRVTMRPHGSEPQEAV